MNGGTSALLARFASGPAEQGTYWIAGADRLVTAAHVVWKHGALATCVVVVNPAGGQSLCGKKQITIFPDYPAARAAPFLKSPADYDVAVIKDPVPGGHALSIQITGATALNGRSLTVCGFPNWQGPMQCAAGPAGAIAAKHRRVVTYQAGTAGGYSGAPVTAPGTAGVVAMHVAGGGGTGFALAIDTVVADFIGSA